MKKLFLLHLVLLASFVQAQRIDTIKVKVHDHVLTLYSSGAGSPAVILESGLGATHQAWDNVRAKVARYTRVIAYDRPGYLNSDSCSKPRNAINVAKELKEALTKAGIKPPYVFAGWSLGGAFVRVFAGLYPKEVVGLVLVDPAPEESYARFTKEFPEQMAEDEKYIKEVLASKTKIGEREEMRYFDSSMNQARRSDAQHNTPTYLLIAAGKAPGGQDRDPSNPLNKIWIEELEKWGKKRTNLQYEIITNSGHHIARFQPDTVVHAIKQLVQKLRLVRAPGVVYSAGETEEDTLPEYIKKLTYKAISSEFILDTAFIANLMDEDFISIYPHKTQNKQQELAGIYRSEINRRKEDHFVDSLYLDDFKVQVFDNTIVATYYSVTKGKKKGVPFYNYRMRWYDVWVKRKGEWKWISSQGTWINK